MNRAFSLLLPTALALFALATGRALAAEPDVVSPLVSYQYRDSLADTPAQPSVVSPVMSYQYFDWPGDENLAFTDSSTVSYYFNGPPQIVTQPTGKAVMVGRTVALGVVADGTVPLTYQWRLNGVNLPSTNGASIQITNAQRANSGSYSVVVQNGHGSVTSSEAVLLVHAAPLTPRPPAPQTVSATEQLSQAQTAVPQIPSSQHLRVKAGATTVDPGKAIVVLTHGWASNSDAWPTQMAAALAKYGSQFNVVTWDWRGNASEILSTAASRTVAEGTALGQALMETLGPNYNRPIHFMGHSLGTLVNCAAANYVHGYKRPRGDFRSASEKYAFTNTHMTLFDEAELVTAVRGMHVVGDAILARLGDEYAAADLPEQLRNFWAKVIPHDSAWIDNYISEVGLPHVEAANVLLWRKNYVNFAIAPHGYAYEWYRDTIADPLSSDMGHRWSFERGTLLQAPVAPRYYLQNLDVNGSEMTVAPISLLTAQSLSWGRPIAYPTAKAAQGLNAAGKATLQALNVIGNGIIQVAGNVSATIGEALSSPGGTPVYLGTAGSTVAFFTDPPSLNLNDLEASWSLNVSMQAGAPQPLNGPTQIKTMAAAVVNASPNSVYTIIPVQMPAEAVGVSFEYEIAGGNTEEFMTMGVGDENNFTMETKFVEDGAWNGTPVIDVSDYAGQETRLVFALHGTTAPPAGTLSIRNIQFYIPPRPELTLTLIGSELVVSWPLFAVDWTLEATSDLSLPNSWQAESGMPDDTDYFHSMTFDIRTTPKGFFRLKK
jgi:pimeloyl-ACP methyl ester carboxylesterase